MIASLLLRVVSIQNRSLIMPISTKAIASIDLLCDPDEGSRRVGPLRRDVDGGRLGVGLFRGIYEIGPRHGRSP
jgi:hypothetical protein